MEQNYKHELTEKPLESDCNMSPSDLKIQKILQIVFQDEGIAIFFQNLIFILAVNTCIMKCMCIDHFYKHP